MSPPLHVAVLDHTARLGGAELALLRTCAALDPERVRVTVVLFADGPLATRLTECGVEVRVLSLDPTVAATQRDGSVLNAGLRALPFTVRLARTLKELAPDVVHTTSLKADLIGGAAARLARQPLVWHVHDRLSDDYLPGSMARLLRVFARTLPRHVVVNSIATARTVEPLPEAPTVVYPGLAPDQRVRRSVAPVPGRPVVGIVGRISPTKGQREFVQACARLASRFPQSRFRIIGSALFAEAPYEREVAALATRLGLGDRLELTGWTDDPVAEMDRLSVMVHASPVPEPFGQVVVEAMARGVPVVATRGGGVEEITGVGAQALCAVVEPGDVGALADAVAAVLEHPEQAAVQAERARLAVCGRFTVEHTAEQLTAVWERVARTGPGRARRGTPRRGRPSGARPSRGRRARAVEETAGPP